MKSLTDVSGSTKTAIQFLDKAKDEMQDRATTYDSNGQRSITKAVNAFNALTGHDITEEQGWLFMQTIKQARSQQGEYREDTYTDAAAYAALAGEAASAGLIK